MYRNVKKKLKNVNICYGTIPVAEAEPVFQALPDGGRKT